MRMLLAAVLSLSMSSPGLIGQSTIRNIDLADGFDELNRLPGPIFASEGLPSMAAAELTGAYDTGELLVRRGGGNFFTRGPEYRLDQQIDLAARLNEALDSQAAAMGFGAPEGDAAAWRIGGSLREIYLESRQIPYGATLFYGYFDAALDIEAPDGRRSMVPIQVHTYYGAYNAGLGRRDEAEAAAANLLINGAQEILARLNRQLILGQPRDSMLEELEALRTSDLAENLPRVRVLGLSGIDGASRTLAALLPGVESEHARSVIIDALAVLGSADSVSLLATRYNNEDEDCRWYTLKAMDYIGTPEALQLVSASGITDDDTGPQRLAKRILSKRQ